MSTRTETMPGHTSATHATSGPNEGPTLIQRSRLRRSTSATVGGVRGIGRVLKQAALDFGYLVIGGMTAAIALGVWIGGVAVGVTLALTILGVFATIAIARVFRAAADVDRFTVGIVADESISGAYRKAAPGSGWFTRLFTVLGDPQTWRDLLWLALHSVIGLGFGIVAVTIVATSLGLIAMPAWWTALPADQGDTPFPINSADRAWIATGAGVLLAAATLGLLHLMATIESRLAFLLLAPSRKQELRARVDHLAATREGAVEAAQARLERIEQDLHDGAQASLVALAMELGIAEQELGDAPELTRARISRARQEALDALGELRDLARGLRPALLAERGVRAAVEGLVARSTLEAEVSFEGDLSSLPRSVETAAYFVVAEAIANAAKHSGAQSLQVLVAFRGRILTVEVADDGSGGADVEGRGLSGLRRRVEALDGQLDIRSPEGGPTSVRAEIPVP